MSVSAQFPILRYLDSSFTIRPIRCIWIMEFVGATCRPTYGTGDEVLSSAWHLCRDVPAHDVTRVWNSWASVVQDTTSIWCSISNQRVSSQLLYCCWLLLLTRRIETCWNIDSCPRNMPTSLCYGKPVSTVDTCPTLQCATELHNSHCHNVKLLMEINAHGVSTKCSGSQAMR